MSKIFPMFVLFVITAVAVLTDGFDFTLYREQKNKTKEKQIMWKDVKNELPTNTFECVVKMWNQFNDTWVTGIGIYDIPTEKWEVSSNLGEQYPVHFWFAVPNL